MPLAVEAGCCECKPPVFLGGSYLRECRDDAFSITDCETKCLDSNPSGFTEGYPKFSHSCDVNKCPKLSESSCCVEIAKRGGNIESCQEVTSIDDCQGDENFLGYFQYKKCDQVEACGHIGKFYSIQGVNDNLGNIPETEEEKRMPVYFVPQVTIPGSISIGGGTFTINKGEGISVDGALLSKYIALVFKWFIWALGIVALAYMGFGGMQWLAAAGNAESINQAKGTIRDSLIGLLLAATSYVILFNINPALVGFKGLKISEIERIRLEMTDIGVKGAKCEPVESGSCSVASLQIVCFGNNATKASSICNVESKGESNLPSGVDINCDERFWLRDQAKNERLARETRESAICQSIKNKPKQPVSFGLFQINLTVHKLKDAQGNEKDCPSAFECAGIDGYTATNHICKVKEDKVDLYNECIQLAYNATINIKKACKISNNGQNWGQWGANRECKFPK